MHPISSDKLNWKHCSTNKKETTKINIRDQKEAHYFRKEIMMRHFHLVENSWRTVWLFTLFQVCAHCFETSSERIKICNNYRVWYLVQLSCLGQVSDMSRNQSEKWALFILFNATLCFLAPFCVFLNVFCALWTPFCAFLMVFCTFLSQNLNFWGNYRKSYRKPIYRPFSNYRSNYRYRFNTSINYRWF